MRIQSTFVRRLRFNNEEKYINIHWQNLNRPGKSYLAQVAHIGPELALEAQRALGHQLTILSSLSSLGQSWAGQSHLSRFKPCLFVYTRNVLLFTHLFYTLQIHLLTCFKLTYLHASNSPVLHASNSPICTLQIHLFARSKPTC